MNITYLLGAGASYNALPVVNKITIELHNFEAMLTDSTVVNNFIGNHGTDKISNDSKETFSEILKELIKSIQWLKNENSKHFSIDTFAKKLYLQKEFHLLNKLKIILSCLFVYLQNTKLDNRYDSFFASILDNLSELPPEFKFLSWNYDYQLEIAYSNFIKNKNLGNCQNSLNVYSKGIKAPKSENKDEFGIFKINGTTTLKRNEINRPILDNVNETEEKVFYEIITSYYLATRGDVMKSTLSFAWEDTSDNYIDTISKCITKTDILVVIGYSFPFFNRKIDQQLLENMPALKSIYIQDPYNAESIQERIESILEEDRVNTIKFKQVKMTDQFYIPFEF